MLPGIQDYGLRIISACLKQSWHDVNLFFLMKEYHKKYSETAMNNLVELTKGSDLYKEIIDKGIRFAPPELAATTTSNIITF